MQDNVFEVINKDSDCELILTCEHAGNEIPNEYDNLGLSGQDLNRHIARDKGGKEITELLAKKLGCFAIMGKYSRLLIDLNRRENEDELIVEVSDGTIIHKNMNLSANEIKYRVNRFYRPYYEAIEEQISRLQAKGKKPIIFSIHSYTPQLRGGDYRPWQAGVLWHKPTKMASFMYNELVKTDKVIGENVPYDLRKYNTGAVVVCGEEKGLDYALIEIRDDEFDDLDKGVNEWADILADILKKYISN